LRDPDLPTESELLQWIEKSIKTRSNIFSYGYQGHVYLYDHEGRRLIVKAPTGWGPIRLLYRAMLRNEHRVYSKLAGLNGIPRCHGLLERRYLVLEYVDGVPIRKANIRDRNAFFSRFFELIEQLHDAGVAHGDMKKKDNVLVVGGCEPYVIDFGVAVVKKPGFAPINRYLYRIAKRFDFNAWVKLKTGFKTGALIEREDEHYERTGVETFARWVKRRYQKVKKSLIAYGKKYY
jgi:predicted Ser/Thr protein kinase